MKKLFLLAAILAPLCAAAQNGLAGGYDYQLYYTPNGDPYIETYFWLNGKTLTYKPQDGRKKAAVEVILIMSQKKDEVTFYDKYVIESNEYASGDSLYGDILDMRRYALPEGSTVVELYIKDLYAEKDRSIERTDTIKASKITSDESLVSEVQFVEMYHPTEQKNNYSKAGFDIIPYIGALYEESIKKLVFYAELYNTDKHFGPNGKFLLTYYLENNESGRQLEDYTVRKRETSASVKPVLAEMNIANLGAGNYNLVVEIRDSLNRFVTKSSRVFRRENTLYTMTEEEFSTLNIANTFVYDLHDPDSIREYIRSLKPIASEVEYQFGKNVMKNGDPTLMKRYLLSFWLKRDGLNPGQAFRDYARLCAAVDEQFGTAITEGYNTDRGRVYIQYGPPAVRSQRPAEANTYPYEIWQYYKLKGQTNIRFVFYNKDMVSNDYTLLHSDLRGEINNRQWEMFLKQRNNMFDVDKNTDDRYGNWSRDLYNQPR